MRRDPDAKRRPSCGRCTSRDPARDGAVAGGRGEARPPHRDPAGSARHSSRTMAKRSGGPPRRLALAPLPRLRRPDRHSFPGITAPAPAGPNDTSQSDPSRAALLPWPIASPLDSPSPLPTGSPLTSRSPEAAKPPSRTTSSPPVSSDRDRRRNTVAPGARRAQRNGLLPCPRPCPPGDVELGWAFDSTRTPAWGQLRASLRAGGPIRPPSPPSAGIGIVSAGCGLY